MAFKYNIDDRFKFGIMDDIIVDRRIASNGDYYYKFKTSNGIEYEESEKQVDSMSHKMHYIPANKPQYVKWYGDDYDYTPVSNTSEKERVCTCDNQTLFNKGCKCGYIEIERSK